MIFQTGLHRKNKAQDKAKNWHKMKTLIKIEKKVKIKTKKRRARENLKYKVRIIN